MIKELCLVPRYLVDKCFKSDVNIIDKKNIGNSELVNDSEKNNLYDEIKTVFKSNSFFVDKCEEPKSLKFRVCPILSYFRLCVIEKSLYCCYSAPLLYTT